MKTKLYKIYPEEKQQIILRLGELLKARNDVLFAYVFGSFAEGLPFHDIDAGIYLAGEVQETASLLALELSHRISEELNMPVDVRVVNVAPVPFRYHVIRGRLLFATDDDLHTQFVERTVQSYLDIEPLLRRGMKEAFAA